jgi:hypothetical protein
LSGRSSLCDDGIPRDSSSLAGASRTSTMQDGETESYDRKLKQVFIQGVWTTIYFYGMGVSEEVSEIHLLVLGFPSVLRYA